MENIQGVVYTQQPLDTSDNYDQIHISHNMMKLEEALTNTFGKNRLQEDILARSNIHNNKHYNDLSSDVNTEIFHTGNFR